LEAQDGQPLTGLLSRVGDVTLLWWEWYFGTVTGRGFCWGRVGAGSSQSWGLLLQVTEGGFYIAQVWLVSLWASVGSSEQAWGWQASLFSSVRWWWAISISLERKPGGPAVRV